MKVNIIYNSRLHTGLSQDAAILRGILTAVFPDITITGVNYNYPECSEADINFFLEVLNPGLFVFARKNIWIPNIEWAYKTWKPYFSSLDEIWVKTEEAETIFKAETTTPVRYITWTSIDKVWDIKKDKKNYYKAIVPVGKNIYRHPKPIFQAYMRIKVLDPTLYISLPTLNIVYDPTAIQINVPADISEKVVMHNFLKESEYDTLLRECGVCICTSITEGFGHAVNEAMSVGCNLILSPIKPFFQLAGNFALFGSVYHQVPHPDCYGDYTDTDVGSLIEALRTHVNRKFDERKNLSIAIRDKYEARHREWLLRMKEFLPSLKADGYSLKDTLPKEEDLPDVSILTITRDRRIFMPLAKYSYMIQSYPEDKLEWVIVDDGDDPIEDTLIGVPNVTYIRSETKLSIGEKRNLAVEKAMFDICVFMDDDDVYPNNSVVQRVAILLKEPVKQCGFCTTIPCYDITKYSSFMNIPPRNLPMSKRVSEATLIFTKKFWEERKFEGMIAEGDAFIQGREEMCREISPQEVIVSLTHPKNTSARKIPDFKEPNGCHFGFNEQLFTLISEIGVALNSGDQKGSESSSRGDGDESGGAYLQTQAPQEFQPLA